MSSARIACWHPWLCYGSVRSGGRCQKNHPFQAGAASRIERDSGQFKNPRFNGWPYVRRRQITRLEAAHVALVALTVHPKERGAGFASLGIGGREALSTNACRN